MVYGSDLAIKQAESMLDNALDNGAEEGTLIAVASGIVDEKCQHQDELPDLMVFSPGKRLRIKAPSPMVLKRV